MQTPEELWQKIDYVRCRVRQSLESTPELQWFEMPAGLPTHIGWQAGHLAMAEYRLGMHSQRDIFPEDELLISTELLQTYGRNSVPVAGAGNHPSKSELLAILDRVHAATREVVLSRTQAELNSPPKRVHPLGFERCLQLLEWLPMHEMSHLGQIALLRRAWGHAPVW